MSSDGSSDLQLNGFLKNRRPVRNESCWPISRSIIKIGCLRGQKFYDSPSTEKPIRQRNEIQNVHIMVKRNQERIYSRLKEVKEMQSGFPGGKAKLKDSRINIEECYRILGISLGASLHEIKQAYRNLAKVWHPHKCEENTRLRGKAEKQLAC